MSRFTNRVLGLVLAIVSASGALSAQQRRLTNVQLLEAVELRKLVDAVSAGQLPGGDAWLKLDHHFLRAPDGKTYVPFTLRIDDAPDGFDDIALYVRVARPAGTSRRDGPVVGDMSGVPSGELPVSVPERQFSRGAPTAGEASAMVAAVERSLRTHRSDFPFEDYHFTRLESRRGGEPPVVRRAFAVAAGTYDVFISVRERPQQGRTPRTAVIKRTIEVPDFSRNSLSVSSLVLADRIVPLSAPIKADRQVERPYALGIAEIVPAADNHLLRDEELSLVFFVHGAAKDPEGHPDVTIEYRFIQLSIPERFFRQTQPQVFNRASGVAADPKGGHFPVTATVPLQSFPAGPYRVEVTVRDAVAQASLTSRLVFTVE